MSNTFAEEGAGFVALAIDTLLDQGVGTPYDDGDALWYEAQIEMYDTGFDLELSDGRVLTVSCAERNEDRKQFAELVAGRVLRRMIAAGPGGRFQSGSDFIVNPTLDSDFIDAIRERAAAITEASR